MTSDEKLKDYMVLRIKRYCDLAAVSDNSDVYTEYFLAIADLCDAMVGNNEPLRQVLIEQIDEE